MLGVGLAVVFGGLQLYLLVVATKSVARGKVSVLAMVGQFFCPLVGLLLCAVLAREQLLLCAIVMSVILLGGAVLRHFRSRRRERDSQEKRD